MPIRIDSKGMRSIAPRLAKVRKKGAILTKRVLEAGMAQIRGSVAIGKFFDNPSGATQQGTWAGDATVKGSLISVEGGWNNMVGPVREFGVTSKNQDGWLIKAKWAKALRFRVGSEIVYVKSLWFFWDDDQKRPHWEPTIKKHWPGIERQLDQVGEAAMRNPN